VRAEQWNALLDWLRASQIIGGENVLVSRSPYGTYVQARPSGVASRGAGAFAVGISSRDGGQVATVSRGLLEGVEPRIEGLRISGADDPQQTPPTLALPTPEAAEGYLYAEVTLSPVSWRAESATIIFSATPPGALEWRAYKLLAILRNSGGAWQIAHQAVCFNLGLYSYGRKASGKARHLFFAR